MPHAESVCNTGWVRALHSPNISRRLYSSAERPVYQPHFRLGVNKESQVAVQAFWLTERKQQIHVRFVALNVSINPALRDSTIMQNSCEQTARSFSSLRNYLHADEYSAAETLFYF